MLNIILESIDELSDEGFELFMESLDDEEYEYVMSAMEYTYYDGPTTGKATKERYNKGDYGRNTPSATRLHNTANSGFYQVGGKRSRALNQYSQDQDAIERRQYLKEGLGSKDRDEAYKIGAEQRRVRNADNARYNRRAAKAESARARANRTK